MIHSLLSSLPKIADDAHDEEQSSVGDLPPLKEESSSDPDNTFFKGALFQTELPDGYVDRDLNPILNHIKTESERSLNDQEQALKSLGPDKVSLQQDPNEDDIRSTRSSPNISDISLENDKDGPGTDEPILNEAEDPEMPVGDPTSIDRSVTHEDDDEILPTSSVSPIVTKFFLTDLLKHADALYIAFPPSHPGLSLSSIMGPQSVVFTWSESPSSLPSDNTAEAMVSCPELVVYPFIETGSDQMKSKESSEGEEKTNKRIRRRRHKLRKAPFSNMEKKTMMAGTVIVLGVAMAIYGVKASGHSTFHNYADAHGQTSTKDWKRLGGWVGSAIAGVTAKILNGLSSSTS